jgi:hypothetical protein
VPVAADAVGAIQIPDAGVDPSPTEINRHRKIDIITMELASLKDRSEG